MPVDPPHAAPSQPSRRAFVAGGTALLAGALAADAFLFEARRLVVTQHDVAVAGLPAALDGLVVAHVTDTHLPANAAVVQEAHDRLAQLRPDLLILSGDIVETPTALGLAADFAAGARATLGACAVLGNWEYARGTTRAAAEPVYARAGVQLLVNQRTVLVRGGARVEVAGFDDLLLGEPDLRLGETDADAALRIWVMHEPGLAAVVRTGAQRPQLLLAGHTHGGQIRVPLMPPYLPEGSSGMAAGWYRPQGLPLYVSRGVGTTNVRARFRCPAELPVFTFRRA